MDSLYPRGAIRVGTIGTGRDRLAVYAGLELRPAQLRATGQTVTQGLDWAHRPALGTTCRTDTDGTTTADACAWCARPLRLTDRTYADGSPVWEVAPMA